MKKIKISLRLSAVLLCLCILLSGCIGNPGNSSSVIETDSSSGVISDNTSNDTSNNKNQLVWITDKQVSSVSEKGCSALNDLLQKKGCDFTVKFEPILDIENIDSVLPAILEMKNSGQQADIIFSELGVGKTVDPYYDNVKNGIFAPLDTYLGTEDGKKLYDALDLKLWDGSRIDGKIYGIKVQNQLAFPVAWSLNKELVNKYNIDTSKLTVNLWDLDGILATVYNGEKANTGLGMLFPYQISPFDGLFNYDMITKAVGVPLDEPNAKAVNVYSQDYVDKWINTMKQYNQYGYNNNTNISNLFANFGVSCKTYSYEYKLQVGSGQSIDFISKTVSQPYITSAIMQRAYNGIASWSQNKDKAFQLLTLANTDKDVANLLAYGIQGTDYTLENGSISMISGNANLYFGNNLILYPVKDNHYSSPDDMKSLNAAAKPSPILGFFFDQTSVQKEIDATDAIELKYHSPLWGGTESDADAALAQMNTELKAAGIDKVLDEVNKQIAQWKKSKK